MSRKKLFLVIGSAKCGTSTLFNWLGQNSSFSMGKIKEPLFFCDLSTREWVGPRISGLMRNHLSEMDAYDANFDGLTSDRWALDASTDYIWYPGAAQRIADMRDMFEIKLMCIVRHPVDRAVSEYNHTIRLEMETLSFLDSVHAEAERIAQGYHPLFYHQRRSTVADDIDRYRSLFGEDLLVVAYQELKTPELVMEKISDHLGVPNMSIEEPDHRANESYLPRNKLAGRILRSDAVKGVARSLVPQDARAWMRDKLMANARDLQTVSKEEKARFQDMMQPEIDRCISNPHIPTPNW